MEIHEIYSQYTKEELIDKLDKLEKEKSKLESEVLALSICKYGLSCLCAIITFFVLKIECFPFPPITLSNALISLLNIIATIFLGFLTYLFTFGIISAMGMFLGAYFTDKFGLPFKELSNKEFYYVELLPLIISFIMFLLYCILK